MTMPPGTYTADYTAASNVALLDLLTMVSPDQFKDAVVEQIKVHGLTHNQRKLVSQAVRTGVSVGGREEVMVDPGPKFYVHFLNRFKYLGRSDWVAVIPETEFRGCHYGDCQFKSGVEEIAYHDGVQIAEDLMDENGICMPLF